MKMHSLTIAPRDSWRNAGPKNPLKAVVKIGSEDSIVECVLSEASMRKMLDLCAEEIANQASKHMADFRADVLAMDGNKSTVLLDPAE